MSSENPGLQSSLIFPICPPDKTNAQPLTTQVDLPTMITRFITEVNTRFNPFSMRSRATRLFLSYLPPNARTQMQVNTTLIPRTSTEPNILRIKFKDGREMNLDGETLGIKGIIEEVDRHSRALQKQADLTEG
ncbi:hypothetical protein EKO27_g540 [Xylaria grammica]|uniref:Large ribosomal subunit protein mL53 n=1 Tax=Xylaria grammica TaxID=363999 RepID=A0A439DJL4_9PEZI|nr:hypothetical protein EKO27_g540 [Xylaria grammica]